MPAEADQVLCRFDFDRVAAEFKARGWLYGLDLPSMGLIEQHTPDAAELRALGRQLLVSVVESTEPRYFIETGRFWAGRVGGELTLRCTGALADAVGEIPNLQQVPIR